MNRRLTFLSSVLSSVLLASACTTAGGSPPATSAGSSSPAVSGPLASASSSGTPLEWHPLGTIPAIDIRGIVGFAGGYIAFAYLPARTVWYSPDGRTWRSSTLPFVVKKVGGYPLEAEALRAATDGVRIVLVGGYTHEPCETTAIPSGQTPAPGRGPRCPLRPIAWVSDDGQSWTDDLPGPLVDAPAGYRQGSEFAAAWPVPTGGWDAAVSHRFDLLLEGRDLMHSSDGLTWTSLVPPPTPTLDAPYLPLEHAGAADASGRRVVWEVWQTFDPTTADPSRRYKGRTRFVSTVATSTVGTAWTDVVAFPGRNASVLLGLAPVGGAPRWVLAGSAGPLDGWGAEGGPTIWTSADGLTWTAVALPVSSPVSQVTGLLHAASGYVAVSGYRGVNTTWGSGTATSHETWLSGDGVTWTELPVSGPSGADYGPGLIADGPAGVIGIGLKASDPSVWEVWELR